MDSTKTDQALFQYDHYFEMLHDNRRMSAFKNAIFSQVMPGDTVVDLGAGTGILGFWALQAGAAKVYCIEQTQAIELAQAIAAQNHLQDRVIFIRDNSKNIDLPEKVDIIVSETLGSFAIDENTLDFTIDARDRFLKPDGKLIPEHIEIQYAPVCCTEVFKKVEFWDDVYGLDFSPAREVFSGKAMVEVIKKEDVLALPEVYAEIDLYASDRSSIQAADRFQFHTAGTVHGISGWFELRLCEGNTLSTSPLEPPTHWKQAFFPIQQPFEVVEGDIMDVSLEVSPHQSTSDSTRIRFDFRCSQLAKMKPE